MLPNALSVISSFGGLLLAFTVVYLVRINSLLKGVPPEVKQLMSPRWTKDDLEKTYRALEKQSLDYVAKIPPKQNRRYVVTGGNGLVGGYIVLQLLARGTPASNIRIIDIRKPERSDMLVGVVTDIEFIKTDIRSRASVDAAFTKPWPGSVSLLPLTVFHTAAVILASDRSKYLYSFPESVNVTGTENVIAAAKAAGATIFSSTSSGSISVRSINPWVSPWSHQPENYWQILNEQDFFQPPKSKEQYYGNYAASKAAAERIVCAANSNEFRTGCIRPANGVYGNPIDNSVGGPLSKEVLPTWVQHIVQSFVHGANVAIGHLQHEAVLLSRDAIDDIPQSGRPFVVTDPNPPITFDDIYLAISTLSVHPFRLQIIPPVLMLCLSYLVEWLIVLPHRFPWLKSIAPKIEGEMRSLQPGIFTICTHLIASDTDARKPVSQGGLGYTGVMTTMQGMVLEILEWNREHSAADGTDKESLTTSKSKAMKKLYTSSVTFADQMRQAVSVGGT